MTFDEDQRQERAFQRAKKHVRLESASFGRDDCLCLDGVEALTFAALSALSKEFGTDRIDINCDLGCESDPGHDRTIILWGWK